MRNFFLSEQFAYQSRWAVYAEKAGQSAGCRAGKPRGAGTGFGLTRRALVSGAGSGLAGRGGLGRRDTVGRGEPLRRFRDGDTCCFEAHPSCFSKRRTGARGDCFRNGNGSSDGGFAGVARQVRWQRAVRPREGRGVQEYDGRDLPDLRRAGPLSGRRFPVVIRLISGVCCLLCPETNGGGVHKYVRTIRWVCARCGVGRRVFRVLYTVRYPSRSGCRGDRRCTRNRRSPAASPSEALSESDQVKSSRPLRLSTSGCSSNLFRVLGRTPAFGAIP